jgi:hypothetical protein
METEIMASFGLPDGLPFFIGPVEMQVPEMTERVDYKKKKGDSDTTKTKDEIVT